MSTPNPPGDPSLTRLPAGEWWDRVVALVRQRTGLAGDGARVSALAAALAKGAETFGCPDLRAYCALLEGLPLQSDAWASLIDALTVGETYFFRHTAHFEVLRTSVFPDLIAARRAAGRTLRLWSAGCATGEEAYSLAMLLMDLLPDHQSWRLHLLATDINPRFLAAAAAGLYTPWSFREQADRYRTRYFVAAGPRYRIREEVQRLVTFRHLNLAEEPPVWPIPETAAMDLILCRNVLLYFTPDTVQAVVHRLSRALAPGGWLFLSPTDPVPQPLPGLLRYDIAGTIVFRHAQEEPGAGLFTPVETPPVLSARAPSAATGGHDALTLVETPPVRPLPPARTRVHHVLPAHRDPQPPPAAPLPPEVAERLAQARSAADRGDLGAAEQICRDLTRREGAPPQVFLLLGQVLEQQGRSDEALQELRRTLYLDPAQVLAWFTAGLIAQHRGHRRAARQALRMAVKLVADLPDDREVPDGDGLTVGRMRQVAQMFLAVGEGKNA